jgi:hypothetical protein
LACRIVGSLIDEGGEVWYAKDVLLVTFIAGCTSTMTEAKYIKFANRQLDKAEMAFAKVVGKAFKTHSRTKNIGNSKSQHPTIMMRLLTLLIE